MHSRDAVRPKTETKIFAGGSKLASGQDIPRRPSPYTGLVAFAKLSSVFARATASALGETVNSCRS